MIQFMRFASFCLVIVAYMCPTPVLAQEQLGVSSCDAIRDETPRLVEKTLASDQGYEVLVTHVKETQDCYGEHINTAWAIWLLETQVYALDRLQRYRESQEAVSEFFSSYASEADSSSLARFYMWDMRFQNMSGNYEASQRSYERGLPYAIHLPEERRYKYYLNASNIAELQGDVKEALEISRRVKNKLPSNADSTMRGTVGRAMFRVGELVIELGFREPFHPDSIKQAIAQIQRAKSFLALANDHHRYVIASVAQGLGYALLGEYERGRPYLDEAANDARHHERRRDEIYVLYSRSRFWHLQKRYRESLADLDHAHALTLQTGILEFEPRRAYLEAQVYEEMKGFDDAQTAYRRAADVADETGTGRDLQIKVASLEAIDRIRGRSTLDTSSASPITYLLAVLSLVLLVVLAYLAVRPPTWLRLRLAGREAAPAPPRLGPAPLEPINPPAIPPSIARTVAYIWLICFHLETWKEAINRLDPALVGKLTADDPEQKQELKPLLLGVYAIEQALGTGDRDELKDPYNSILKRLGRFFHEGGWPELPKGLYGWRLFFIERGWDAKPPAWLREQLP